MSCCGPAQRGLGGKEGILRDSTTRGEGALCPSPAYNKAISSTKQNLLCLKHALLGGISKPYSVWSTTLVQIELHAPSRREGLPFRNGVLKRKFHGSGESVPEPMRLGASSLLLSAAQGRPSLRTRTTGSSVQSGHEEPALAHPL